MNQGNSTLSWPMRKQHPVVSLKHSTILYSWTRPSVCRDCNFHYSTTHSVSILSYTSAVLVKQKNKTKQNKTKNKTKNRKQKTNKTNKKQTNKQTNKKKSKAKQKQKQNKTTNKTKTKTKTKQTKSDQKQTNYILKV